MNVPFFSGFIMMPRQVVEKAVRMLPLHEVIADSTRLKSFHDDCFYLSMEVWLARSTRLKSFCDDRFFLSMKVWLALPDQNPFVTTVLFLQGSFRQVLLYVFNTAHSLLLLHTVTSV